MGHLVWIFLVGAMFGQASTSPSEVVTIHKEVESAFVWRRTCQQGYLAEANRAVYGVEPSCKFDPAGSATPSLVIDPLSGEDIRKLSYQGVEVGAFPIKKISQKVLWSRVDQLVGVKMTIVNNTDSPLHLTQYSSNLPLGSEAGHEFFACKKKAPCNIYPELYVQPGASQQVSVYAVYDVSAGSSIQFAGDFPPGLRFSIKLNDKDFVFVY